MANSTDSKETKKAQAIREKQERRDIANKVRGDVSVSFIAFLGTMLNSIIARTKEACNGRMVADVAERIGRDSGKIEVTRKVNGKAKLVLVNDPLKSSLFAAMGLLAACGLATGEVAALLLEQGLISERSIINGDGLEALTIRAKVMARTRSFIKLLVSHGVVSTDSAALATDYKAIRTMLTGKSPIDSFDRVALGKATGAKVTTAMVQAIRARLAELRESTTADRLNGKLAKNESHKLTTVEFLAIVQPADAPPAETQPAAPPADLVSTIAKDPTAAIPPAAFQNVSTGASVGA